MLKKAKRKPISQNPGILLLYGPPKVGKTTMLSQLDDCLILDTENGTAMVEAYVHSINSRKDLIAFVKESMEGHEYKYFALDTIDKIVEWAEKSVCEEHNVVSLVDLAFGKGYGLMREKVMNTIRTLKNQCDHLIIIGHRKPARAVVEGDNIVEPESLDITGKLRNMIMADCDACGYVFRDNEENLKVSFKSSNAVEAGSRSPHLRGEILDFDWKKIYKTDKIKKGAK